MVDMKSVDPDLPSHKSRRTVFVESLASKVLPDNGFIYGMGFDIGRLIDIHRGRKEEVRSELKRREIDLLLASACQDEK